MEVNAAVSEFENRSVPESVKAPGARVLVVDDTKMNLMVLASLLKKTEAMVDTAASGAEAVEKAAKTAYDLILMDQRMPGMDGTEAMHNIRSTEGGASSAAPVICLTADDVSGAKEKYLAEGFADYLTKPVESAALKAMLFEHLPADKIQ